MQAIGANYYDKKNRYGHVEINGHGIGIGENTIGYKPDGFTPITHLTITVAYDYNMTGRFTIHAATLKGLLGKIRKHKSKLVKPK